MGIRVTPLRLGSFGLQSVAGLEPEIVSKTCFCSPLEIPRLFGKRE
jgi:hypothetical protein